MDNLNVLIAGFGGQGVLFAGKVMAYSALIDNREVSWLPSYGPEMRGGTANCSICISDESIGSPLVVRPNVFVAMNLPSFDKFINDVKTLGTVLVDSSLINKKTERNDINVVYVEASKTAEKNGVKGLGNIILIGRLLKEIKFASQEAIDEALIKCIPRRKANMLEMNRKALEIGQKI